MALVTWENLILCEVDDVLKYWNEVEFFTQKHGFDDTVFTTKLNSLIAYVDTLTDHAGFESISALLATLSSYSYAGELDQYYSDSMATVQAFLQGVLDVIEGEQQFHLVAHQRTVTLSYVDANAPDIAFRELVQFTFGVYRSGVKLTHDANGTDPTTFRVLGHTSDNVKYTYDGIVSDNIAVTPISYNQGGTGSSSSTENKISMVVQVNGTNIVLINDMFISVTFSTDESLAFWETPDTYFMKFNDSDVLQTTSIRITAFMQGSPAFPSSFTKKLNTENGWFDHDISISVVDNIPLEEVIDLDLTQVIGDAPYPEFDDLITDFTLYRLSSGGGTFTSIRRTKIHVLRGDPVTSELTDVISNYSDFEYLNNYLDAEYIRLNRQIWITEKYISDAKDEVLKTLIGKLNRKRGFEDFILNPAILLALCAYKTLQLLNESISINVEDQFSLDAQRFNKKYRDETLYVINDLIIDKDGDSEPDNELGGFTFRRN